MRGCLFVLVAAALVVGLGAWFGSAPLASAVIDLTLRNAGFSAATLTTTARADPPPRLLLGHADTVRIQATGVAFRTFHADGLDLTLTDVDLIGRTAATIRGSISRAQVTTADRNPAAADVTVDGDASGAASTIHVDRDTVDRVVRATLGPQVGSGITRTELVAPDLLRVVTPAATIEGRLVIDGSGALAFSNALGTTPILELDRSFPLRLTGVHVEDGDLVIDGTLDAEALLGR